MDAETVVFEGFEGLHLVADVRGDPEAWPVLFLHGGGQTRNAWGATAEVVARAGWRAVALDLRGHGDSDWAPNGDYSFTAFCADCVAVADQLGRPPVLVGASLGGMSAMLAEGTSDRTVSCGLVLVDITPKTNDAGIERITRFMQSGFDGFDSLEEAAEAIAAYTPQRKRSMNPAGLMKVLRQRGDRWYWHWDPRVIGQERTEVVPDRLAGLLERGHQQHPCAHHAGPRTAERCGDPGRCRRPVGPDPRGHRGGRRRRRPHDRRRSQRRFLRCGGHLPAGADSAQLGVVAGRRIRRPESASFGPRASATGYPVKRSVPQLCRMFGSTSGASSGAGACRPRTILATTRAL